MELPKNEYRISITSACNMKCIYCHNEGNRYNISLEKEAIEKLIINSYGLGLEKIRLTGGEPTVHYEFLDICKMLKEKYCLQVGVNTNGINIDILMKAINNGWIDKVTVGIDYADGYVSKQSPVGKPSKEILANILAMKNVGCVVNLATVYNGNDETTRKIVNWGIKNNIRVKIIELIENKIEKETDPRYISFMAKTINENNLIRDLDQFNQVIGRLPNGDVAVSFFHSHCKLRECDICKKIQLRVTAKGKLKECLHYNDDDICYMNGNIRENIVKVLSREINYHR